ncbi:MAG: hypothetical protein MRY74_02595 [Neomegalonema sp.]|nr:hypothetical protein [Neomegalonema sp.]
MKKILLAASLAITAALFWSAPSMAEPLNHSHAAAAKAPTGVSAHFNPAQFDPAQIVLAHGVHPHPAARARRWAYRHSIHGPRYRSRRAGYIYFYRGWYYARPWWEAAPAAPAAARHCAYWADTCSYRWGFRTARYFRCMRIHAC